MKPTTKIRKEQGQTMVEFTLVLPILAVMLFAIIQFGLTFNNYVTLTDAIRAGARKAAVSRLLVDPSGACRAQVLAAGDNLDPTELGRNLSCTSTWAPGSDVTVHADYPYDIKLLNWVVFSGRLNSTMKERVE